MSGVVGTFRDQYSSAAVRGRCAILSKSYANPKQANQAGGGARRPRAVGTAHRIGAAEDDRTWQDRPDRAALRCV